MMLGYVLAGEQGRRPIDAAYGSESFNVDAGVSVLDRSGHFAVIVCSVVEEVKFSESTENVLVIFVARRSMPLHVSGIVG